MTQENENIAVGYTGDICQETGSYQCENHQTTYIKVTQEETFPPCLKNPDDPHDATWILVQKDAE